MNKKLKIWIKRILKGILVGFISLLIILGSLSLWWVIRPNTARINSHLDFTKWTAVSNGRHNANTDLILWKGHYYFIYANQPGNQGSDTTFLSLNRGKNLHNLREILTLNVPGEDIRDPKFAIIQDKLFVFYLKNKGFIADPYGTAYVYTTDGKKFSDPEDVKGFDDWLFWRPKTLDNITWYCTASSAPQTKCILLKSTDGFNWEKVSSIAEGTGLAEIELLFLSDKRMLISIRDEVDHDTVLGRTTAGTGLGISKPPYKEWKGTVDALTKLDGPVLFKITDSSNNSRYFAVGRFQPDRDIFFTASGSVFSRKRTSLFEFINLDKSPELRYISDLPSSGDTAYGGVIVEGNHVYISYYSSPPDRDYGWLMGMLLPSDIFMIDLSISSLLKAADHPLEPAITLPWDNYIVVSLAVAVIIIGIYLRIRKIKRREESEENTQ